MFSASLSSSFFWEVKFLKMQDRNRIRFCQLPVLWIHRCLVLFFLMPLFFLCISHSPEQELRFLCYPAIMQTSSRQKRRLFISATHAVSYLPFCGPVETGTSEEAAWICTLRWVMEGRRQTEAHMLTTSPELFLPHTSCENIIKSNCGPNKELHPMIPHVAVKCCQTITNLWPPCRVF